MDAKLFIDTMVFLHFRPLDELDLRTLTGAESITLVVPRITLRELDKHKSIHAARKVRDRARRVLSELETAIAESRPLKGNIAVQYIPEHPKEQIEKLHLNESWADDILVASVIAYQESTGIQNLTLISQDAGPRLTCRQHGVATLQLNDSLSLPEDVDELERENRELVKQIERLKNAMPRLEAKFVGSQEQPNVAKFSLSPHPALDEGELAVNLADCREAYPRLSVPGAVPKNHPLAGTFNSSMHAMAQFDPNAISPEQYRRYNGSLDYYFFEVESYLRQLHEFQEALSRTISFSIEIRNTGTAPADDVDVLFHFPDGFKLMSEDDLPVTPQHPQPPCEPLSRTEQLTRILAPPGPIIAHQPAFPSDSSFHIEETNSYDVIDHFTRIKHGVTAELPTMYIEFPSLSDATSFKCTYELRPANLTDPVLGEMHFVITIIDD